MRWVSVAAIACGVVIAPATAGAASRCTGSKDSVTAVANAQVRVYRTARHSTFYACSKVTGKVTKLGPPSSSSGLVVVTLSRWRLQGSLVAYARERGFYKEFPTFLIVVRDVRSGRTLRTVNAAPSDGSNEDPPDEAWRTIGVRDLVLTADGRVAWIVTNPLARGVPTQVWKADRAGVGLLDAGPDVGPASLELSGDVVRWVRDGVSQTARLA
jgi:hypothetical protein